MAVEVINQMSDGNQTSVEAPAPTPWPIILAFGLSLVFGGLVTSAAVSVLGGIISIAGTVGWFRDVLPHEAHEFLPVVGTVPAVTTSRREVARVADAHELQRARLPVESHPISAGIKGGLVGSVAMAGLAMLYGYLRVKSVWYPINLLSAGFFPNAMTETTAQIAAFHWKAFLLAVPIHLVTSLLVGLLYGAMLPMLPRHPILLGGFVGPILWSGVIHSILGIVNPLLDQRVDWMWFVASQVGYGLVAGYVVSCQRWERTWQPRAARRRVHDDGDGQTR